jgi:hypothetical protein
MTETDSKAMTPTTQKGFLGKNRLTKPETVVQNGDRFDPGKGISESSTSIRHHAHRRLEEILDDAENRQLHGTVGLEVTFDNGQPTLIRRTLNGTDKVARS